MGVRQRETGWAGWEASSKDVGGRGDKVDKPVCSEDGRHRSPGVTVSERGTSVYKGFSNGKAEQREQWILGRAQAELPAVQLVAVLLVAIPVSPALLRCITWTEVTYDTMGQHPQ